MNKNRDLKYNIYTLKRLHGQPATVHKRTVGEVDYTSGEQTVTNLEINIKRAILLPINYSTQRYYSMMVNSFGAHIQVGDREVIIDRIDLTSVVETGDYFTIAEKRYEIIEIVDLDEAYHLLLRNTQNE